MTFGFVLGLGTWSIFAPLESAAVASGVLGRNEPQDDPASRRRRHPGDPGEGRRQSPGRPVPASHGLRRTRSRLASLEGQYWDAVAREARLLAERDGRDAIALPPDLQGAAGGGGTLATVIQGHREIFEPGGGCSVPARGDPGAHRPGGEGDHRARGAGRRGGQRAEIAREETSAVSALVDKGLGGGPGCCRSRGRPPRSTGARASSHRRSPGRTR